MKKLAVLLSLLSGAVTLLGADFSLVKAGKLNAAIVHSEKKEPRAVTLFNESVSYCTGKKFPVLKKAGKGNNIIIKLVDRTIDRLDEYEIAFPNKNTMVITATAHSLNGAFNYILENYFNCRFLFSRYHAAPYKEEINHYPKANHVSMPLKKVKIANVSYNLRRQIDWRNTLWQRRWNNKMGLGACHMISYFAFPVHKYARNQSWPKNVMPLLANGKRLVLPKATKPIPKNRYNAIRGYAMWNPCFTHPDTTRIAIENILEYMKKNPETTEIDLSINDNGNMCLCPVCKKTVGGKRGKLGHANYAAPYWKWINNIANKVCAKYPNLFITTLAYREVIDAPSFKLHKNVVPTICFELAAMNDPEVYQKRIQMLAEWQKAAENICFWDYSYGIRHFFLPRIYFKSHSKFLKLIREKYNVRGIFIESDAYLAFEGPKHYLMAKVLYDVNTDPEKVIQDWCKYAVGKKAAPYLRKYYQFWEDYWTGSEIKKVNWYKSKNATYLTLGEAPTHTYAFQKGDMKKLRSYMEKVVAYASTPKEKERARVLMKFFELSELSVKAMASEVMPSNGHITNAKTALELIQALPEAIKANNALLKHPYIKEFPAHKKIQTSLLGSVGKIMPFLNDKKVKAAALKFAADPATPLEYKALFKIWMGAKAKNLIKNGSFEEKNPLPRVLWNEGGAYRSAKKASHGDFGFRVPPFCCYAWRVSVDPEKTYLFMFDAYIKKASIEGNANFQLTTMSGKRHNRYIGFHGNKLQEGRWVTLCGIGKVGTLHWHKPGEDYGIQLMIFMRKFEQDDEIYIDNVRAYCLDDVK